ncbi:uncharacterized protein LOC135104317 isoform X2 [Scylla paramamosain]|uniref:uncharacterized protein LOC135104317 isoform X2 n=1 Tax=Scylla paramamosain TaxID=85552 RepID=UPI0030826FD8
MVGTFTKILLSVLKWRHLWSAITICWSPATHDIGVPGRNTMEHKGRTTGSRPIFLSLEIIQDTDRQTLYATLPDLWDYNIYRKKNAVDSSLQRNAKEQNRWDRGRRPHPKVATFSCTQQTEAASLFGIPCIFSGP